MSDGTTCARHPGTETRLRCSSCDTPICPRCAVESPVGLRCPSCAGPSAGGGLRRRPEQVGRAAAVAVAGALLGGVALAVFDAAIGFGSIVVAVLLGVQLGRRVRAAASGNTVDVVRAVATVGGGAIGVVAVVAESVLLGAGLGWYDLAIVIGGGIGGRLGMD